MRRWPFQYGRGAIGGIARRTAHPPCGVTCPWLLWWLLLGRAATRRLSTTGTLCQMGNGNPAVRRVSPPPRTHNGDRHAPTEVLNDQRFDFRPLAARQAATDPRHGSLMATAQNGCGSRLAVLAHSLVDCRCGARIQNSGAPQP